MSAHSSSSLRTSAQPQALLGDKVMLAAVGLSAAAAVLTGYLYFEPVLDVVGALVFAGVAAAAQSLMDPAHRLTQATQVFRPARAV
jgi:methyl-accepting chemotaxis protein